MIDWKGASILDQSYTADMKEVGRRVKNGSIGDLGASLKLSVLHDNQSRFRNQQFPLLIQVLEEQESRIEFLVKALDQATYISDASVDGNYIVAELEAPAGSEPSTTINWFLVKEYPELAQYLEEKNV